MEDQIPTKVLVDIAAVLEMQGNEGNMKEEEEEEEED